MFIIQIVPYDIIIIYKHKHNPIFGDGDALT